MHRTLPTIAAWAALCWAAPVWARPDAPHPIAGVPVTPKGVADSYRDVRDSSARLSPAVEAVRRVRDAVVNIHSERTAMGPVSEDLFALAPSQNRINGMGTGILIDARGYIITNHHVVEDVQLIRVRLADGTVANARVLAREPEADLALLKIDVGRPLPSIPLGTSSDLLVAENVLAIGNAYGYEHTVTRGIVSALGRDVVLNKDVSYKALIQTDAPINPGNSGGPLINLQGELIGVNVAIRAGAQSIGFAIPVDTMIRVGATMLATRGIGRSALAGHGLTVHDDVQRPSVEAAFVRQVVIDRADLHLAGGKAGLQAGDVLERVADTPIQSSLDLERALIDRAPGDRLPVVFRRGSAEHRVDLVLEPALSAGVDGDLVWRKLGLKLQNTGSEGVTRSHPQLHGGLIVVDVRAESTAGKAGIQRGDILVGLHDWEMLTMENVLYVLNHPKLATFGPLRYYVLRSGQVYRGVLNAVE